MHWVTRLYHTIGNSNHPLRSRGSIAILVFLVAFAARCHLATTGRIEYDEKDYARAAVQYANHFKDADFQFVLHDNFNHEHPVFNKLVFSLALLPFQPQEPFDLSMHFSVEKIDQAREVVSMRLVSVFFGSLAAFLLALVNPLAGLLLALHTFAIKYTSVIYLEALPMFSALASLQSFTIFLRSGPAKHHLPWLALSATTLGVAAASKYMYGVIGVAIILYCVLWMARQRRPLFGYLVLWGLLSLLIFFAADPYIWSDPLQRLSASLKFNVDFANGPAVKYTAYPLWQPVAWLLKSMPQHPATRNAFFLQPGDFLVSIDTLIFALSVLGLPLMIKRNANYFIWLLVGMMFLLIWKTKWPQYVLLVLPPLCVAAANGVETLSLVLQSGTRKWITARRAT